MIVRLVDITAMDTSMDAIPRVGEHIDVEVRLGLTRHHIVTRVTYPIDRRGIARPVIVRTRPATDTVDGVPV